MLFFEAASQAWDRELIRTFGDWRSPRLTEAGRGEPGTALRAVFERWRNARDELGCAEDDRGGADEFRGYRPRRSVEIDHTGGRF